KNQQPPFRLLYTAPHFGQSPKAVQDSIIGNAPKGDRDIPFVYDYEPETGGAMNIHFRFQVAMPVYNNKERVLSSQFPNTVLPVFWVDSHGAAKDFVVDLLRLSSVTVPTVVFWVKIATTVLTVMLVVFAVAFQ
ncbi:Protein SCAV-5, partial [Aphelenchoides avenae]